MDERRTNISRSLKPVDKIRLLLPAMNKPLVSVAELAQNKNIAISTYRSLLRAIRTAFNPSPQLSSCYSYLSPFELAKGAS